MTKLDELKIIDVFQIRLGNKKFVPEDVEVCKIGKINLASKVDTLVESTDIPPKMTLKEAARKSVVSCVSDFIAKGVRPEFGIISVNLPKPISREKVFQITNGLKKAADEFGFKILGGDTNEGREVVIHVCLFGQSKKISKRRGAKSGDFIFVTGPFGYVSSGLEILINKRKAKKQFLKKAIKSVKSPKLKMEFCLKNSKYFSSSMDSSDGLSTTLNELASQSRKKFVINLIPTKKEVNEFAKLNKINPLRLIFDGGEEFETVFTVSPRNRLKVIKRAKENQTPLIEIGKVTNGRGVFLKQDSRMVKIKDLGWKHFRQ